MLDTVGDLIFASGGRVRRVALFLYAYSNSLIKE